MNDDQKSQQARGVQSGRTNGFFPSSLRAISSYLKVVSSGASNVAQSAASVASSIVDRDDDANSDQIHCFDVETLEREYTILTNPIVVSCPGSGGVRYGPLAVGSRWMAYSGSPVTLFNYGHVNLQDLTTLASFPGFSSNGSLVAHYAKESSKQLASGIVSLGDMGYKKLSRYYSDHLSDGNCSSRSVNSGWMGNGTINGHSVDTDNIGMVIVRDIVSKNVVTQLRAHNSPISALRFDLSGTLLVTASVQGHNINVYKIMPCHSEALDAGPSNVHLYRLQRGYTNAIIQDISFSGDSNWIMISSSRGTSHLFAINPQGGSVNIQALDCSLPTQNNRFGGIANQGVLHPHSSALQMHKKQSLCATGPPITLSVVSRLRNGTNSWRGTMSGAAAAATGKMGSLSGAIASSFCDCKGSGIHIDGKHSKTKYHLLVFSSSGSMIQYALQVLNGRDSAIVSGLNPVYELAPQVDARLVVEAIQKWNICQRLSLREREDSMDIYGDNGIPDGNKIYPAELKEDTISSPKFKNGVVKANSSSEEYRHMYISQAELQMLQTQTPLWAKSEIYFHSMVKEATIIDEAAAAGGEFEIERIPTRMIQATSKHLIPVFDYLQTPKVQQTRAYALDGRLNEQLLHQSTGMSENGKISDCTTNSTELDYGFQVPGLDDNLLPTKTRGYVNKNNSPKPSPHFEIVNNYRAL